MASVVEQLMNGAKNELLEAQYRGIAAGIDVGFKVAKREVPVKTGALKATLKRRFSVSKRTGKVFGEVSAKTAYAWYAEYGNGRGWRGKPYLRPAFIAAANSANKVIVETIQQAIKHLTVE